MIRDITIGQYYPVKSRIHSLDPRVKIICTLLFLVSLFVQSSFLGYVIATLFLGMVIYMSKVPLKYIVKGLKPIVILLMFTVVMNLFLTRGGETLLHFWIFTITEEGVRTSVFMALRLMYLVAGSSLMTFTTSPNGLMDGMEKLLNPLNKLHLPVHEVAMIMSIALRFIPILLEETDKIMKAHLPKGSRVSSSSLKGQRSRNLQQNNVGVASPPQTAEHLIDDQYSNEHHRQHDTSNVPSSAPVSKITDDESATEEMLKRDWELYRDSDRDA